MIKSKINIIILVFLFSGSQLFASSLLKQVEPGEREYESSKSSGDSEDSSSFDQVEPDTSSDKKKSAKKQTPQLNKSKFLEKSKGKYSLEDAARILRNGGIVDFQLDHDDHVYKCIRIANNAMDLEGAVEAINAYKTKFEDTIDKEEVDLIIRISKVDTVIYRNIAFISKKIGKTETTVKEHFNIVGQAEIGNGQHLLNGIERARACSYIMENDYFSTKRLDLFANIGKLKQEDRFFDIYSAMRRVGLNKQINYTSLEMLYKMYLLKGDVPNKILNFLNENKWRSRKQAGMREYYVVRDVMNSNETPYPMFSTSPTKVPEVKKKPKKKTYKKKLKRKSYPKKEKPKKIKKEKPKKIKKKKSSFFNFDDPCSQIIE